MTHKGTQSIRTKRLLLRQYRTGDERQMFENFLSDPKVTKHVNWVFHTDIKETQKFLEMHLEKYPEDASFYGWGIEMGGEIIGSIGAFDVDENIRACEIGYSLGSKYWGQGITTEAADAVLDFLFGEVGFNRVIASHNEGNTASGKVLKKIGMSYEGTCRDAALRKDGTLENLILYAVLKQDYEIK